MEKELNFFRIKMAWAYEEVETGKVVKVKTEDLVLVGSYTEAEAMAYSIIEEEGRDQFDIPTFEIIKTKIDRLIFTSSLDVQRDPKVNGLILGSIPDDDRAFGLYAVTIVITTIDEKTAEEKQNKASYYVPATSSVNAVDELNKYLSKSMLDYTVRDVKFDKADKIYMSEEEINKRIEDYKAN